MIEWIVRQLFRWDSLRSELLAEATFYNSITRVMKDPEAMETALAFWEESDGWRGWSHNKDLNKYYFNDYPEYSFSSAMTAMDEMDGSIRL
jgi:hypothetical protein